MSEKLLKICIDPIVPGPELAVETQKSWTPGQILRVRFLDGLSIVQTKVEQYAHVWEQHANIKFIFGNDPNAEIRISFRERGASWSTIGKDLYHVPMSEPTMNFGWLYPETEDAEYQRVVLHEFGHALGCIHEHQHPKAGIQWNKPAVYDYYNKLGWTTADVDFNLFTKYSVSQTQFSKFDPKSIMLYPIQAALTLDGYHTDWNETLSTTDKAFIKEVYPFS